MLRRKKSNSQRSEKLPSNKIAVSNMQTVSKKIEAELLQAH